MRENERLTIWHSNGKITAYFRGEETAVDCSKLPYPNDFLYACAYLIDELAKDLPILNPQTVANEPFEGRTVCIASNHLDIFEVGKIYEWKDGRTVGEDGLLHPTTGKLFSLDEITNPNLKFFEIAED